ncbi:PAS domain S-box protein [Anaerolineales bacterium HSG25]|nr:PAS domain S-box protein [Anaerolineales bacterium HSG25]
MDNSAAFSQPLWGTQKDLQQFIEAAPLGIVTTNQAGEIVFVNRRLETMFGYSREELLGQPVEILIPVRFHDSHVKYRHEYQQTTLGRPMGAGMDLVGQHKNGTQVPIEVGLSMLTIGSETYIQALITDITIRQQTQERLEQRVQERTQEIERRRQVSDSLRGILRELNSNNSLSAVLNYIVKQAGQLLSAKASAIFRLIEQELVLQTSQNLPYAYVQVAHLTIGEGAIGEAVLSGEPVLVPDLTQRIGHGSDKTHARRQMLFDHGYQAVLAVPLRIKNTLYGGIVLYYDEKWQFTAEDIELAVTFGDQVALAIENARMRTQVERAAVAAERSRLARDLHDSVTQTLFSASVIAEVLPRLWKKNLAESERRVEELRQLTRGALAEMRTLLLELRPATLTEVPLGDLLRQLGEATAGRAKIPITVELEGKTRLLPDVQVALYRITQEALNNVAKHANATGAVVRATVQPRSAILSIQDDGTGFKWAGVEPRHLGLKIMQERAEAIRADFSVDSQLEHGTTIRVVWQRDS